MSSSDHLPWSLQAGLDLVEQGLLVEAIVGGQKYTRRLNWMDQSLYFTNYESYSSFYKTHSRSWRLHNGGENWDGATGVPEKKKIDAGNQSRYLGNQSYIGSSAQSPKWEQSDILSYNDV